MSECCFREYRSGAGGGDTCCCLGDVFDVVQEGLVEGHVFHSSAADGMEWDDIGRDGDGTTRRDMHTRQRQRGRQREREWGWGRGEQERERQRERKEGRESRQKQPGIRALSSESRRDNR